MYHPLVDRELVKFIDAGGIENCPLDLVNPASVNLTIGYTAKIEVEGADDLQEISLLGTSLAEPLLVPPGGWVLCDVGQYLRLPPDVEAQVILRSSAARAGWDHALAGYVDPGYHGRLTLEFVNCLRWKSLPLYQGQQLVQLRIYQLDRAPAADYSLTGRYHQANRVEANKDPTV